MSHFSRDLGIDLGTANILVFMKGRGIVLREPSVVAVSQPMKEILAVGEEARLMIGRTPGNISAIRPMSDGVIAHYTFTYRMLEKLIEKVYGRHRLIRPRLLICVPSSATVVERRAVLEAARAAGAGEAWQIEEPLAAAIGANLPISGPTGNMVIDIGGGTTDIAVISLGAIVVSDSLRIAGNKLDEVIMRHIKRAYNLAVGERTGEEIKIAIGSVYPCMPESKMHVRGRDLLTGLPATVEVTSTEIREALSEPISQLVQRVKSVLEQTPPELAADIIERGIVLTGGGALLRGLDRLLAQETRVPVYVADDPLSCVAMGTGKAIEDTRALQRSARAYQNFPVYVR
ncbi:MAG TPA: rod shape-determining protein [Armatimonadota bacterium]|nr:rod shape-determining protein [Armatimonadota bacterium]